MKKLLLIFTLYILFLTSCKNRSDYNENLNICEDLVVDINNFFCDTTSFDYLLSNYYTDDFIFQQLYSW